MNRKFFAIAAMLLLAPIMVGAQALKGSYFLDNSLNRNKLNPAFAPSTGYFQIPVIGNSGAGVMSNMELSTFLYPVNGQLYTFLNKNVTVDQLESALARNPYMDINADVNIINFGWKRGDGFWTVDMGVKVNAGLDIPKDLFLFMKKGTGTSGSYNIGQLSAKASASLQAAVGYSRDLSDLVKGLRVGAKARVLLPVAYTGLDLHNLNLVTSPERWTVTTDATLNTAVKNMEVLDSDGGFAPAMNGLPGISGFGLSFDLGAEYKLEFDGFINGVSVSAAVTDLGFLNYKSAEMYASNGTMDWTGLAISLEEGAMNQVFEDLKEEFSKLYEFRKAGSSSLSSSTFPSIYAGVEAPFLNNMMSVGFLYSARKSFNYMRNELTLSYNLNPVDWFAFGINYSFLNVAKTMGCILEFTPKAGPCFYVGVDYFPMEWTNAPDNLGIGKLPMSMRFNAQVGLAIALGGNK